MNNYKELTDKLLSYSAERKGEIADLTYEAAVAIGTLEGRVKALGQEIADLKEEDKRAFETLHSQIAALEKASQSGAD